MDHDTENPEPASRTVSFRLPDALHSLLAAKGEAVGRTPGQYAKKLITDALLGSEAVRPESLATTLESELQRLRRRFRDDLRTTLSVLLMNLDLDVTKQQVSAMVDHELPDEPC